jgi:SAM-dependent methyltransferase
VLERHVADDSRVYDVCPLCAGASQNYMEVDGVANSGRYFVDTCTACGFVYTRNVPSSAFLRECYRDGHTDGNADGTDYVPDNRFHKRLKNWLFAKRIRQIAKPGRARVLEVGFARGHLLKALHREGTFEVEGIDFGEATFRYLKSLGLNVSLASIEDMNYPAGHFDVVVGLHVLEHVQDPFKFIDEVHRVLSPGGRLYLQVPSVAHWRARRAGKAWRAISPPFHLWYFAPTTIRLFLTQHGFRVLSAHCLSHRTNLTVVAEKA